MADIQIPYLPPTDRGDFDLKLQEVIDILRYYISEHDTSLSTIESNGYVNYTDRGDPAAADFAVGDLTTNGSAHDLDLSSIVASGAKVVHLRVAVMDDAVPKTITFYKKGNSNTVNAATAVAAIASQTNYADIWVALNAGSIKYEATSGTWSTINITVRGWLI